MTTREIMEMTYQQAGEPSDLCPYTDPGDYATFDITRAESLRLLGIVNMALKRIASWRFRDGRTVKHRGLLQRAFWSSGSPVTGTVISSLPSATEIENLAVNVADQFNGWLIEITSGLGAGQIRLVVDTTIGGASTTVFINTPWDTDPDSTSGYSLYRGFARFTTRNLYTVDGYEIQIDPVSELQDVLKIRDVATFTDLSPSMKEDLFTSGQTSPGIPTEFKIYGNQILFDSAIAESRGYEIFYLRLPTPLSTAAQIPDIGDAFHEAIVLWGVHSIQRMNQAFGPAYATKRELEDYMEMVRIQGSSEMDYEMGGILIYG